MKNHVTSLEISKELNKLLPNEYKDSVFVWANDYDTNYCITTNHSKTAKFGMPTYSAYLASEIGEMLPDSIKSEFPNSWVAGKYERYFCAYETADHSLHDEYANTLQDAMAKMLIYLLINNLIKL